MFKNAFQQVVDEEKEETVRPLKKCLNGWKEKKEAVDSKDWEVIDMKPSDKYLIMKLLIDLFYYCFLQTVYFLLVVLQQQQQRLITNTPTNPTTNPTTPMSHMRLLLYEKDGCLSSMPSFLSSKS